ncbi:PTS sugar transporter subunit IIA [Isobaculum melis]|uniref:PTS system, glucose-specific IIA component n=1 Tax=Isobaculum melis TaxID=142588 RepID=A0A1H9UEY7_9LACT|nr:PTS glucose transporter subunit IIA [Isobaculum melis]SES07724.1 PTS system, glucose-specific IIA component [Isobaculum melis]
MGLFFNKKKEAPKTELVAVADGQLIALADVPDPVFAQKMMGEGFAVEPTGNVVVAPIAGEIIQVADTLHAYGIQSEEGVEVLVHIGLDTVALKGEGFEAQVKMGDKVVAGTPLAKIDLAYLAEHAPSTTIPVIVTNGNIENYAYEIIQPTATVAGETVALRVTKA